MLNNQRHSLLISSSSSNHLNKHVLHTMLFMKIHMAEDGVVVEGEGGVGAGVDMGTIKVDMVTIKVDMETIKIMVDIQTGAKEVGEAEVGAIVVLDIKEAEVEGVEGMAVGEDGWAAVQGGMVATMHSQNRFPFCFS